MLLDEDTYFDEDGTSETECAEKVVRKVYLTTLNKKLSGPNSEIKYSPKKIVMTKIENTEEGFQKASFEIHLDRKHFPSITKNNGEDPVLTGYIYLAISSSSLEISEEDINHCRFDTQELRESSLDGYFHVFSPQSRLLFYIR